jgi:hypothetical protein
MRTAPVVVAAVMVACLACTYDIPDLASRPDATGDDLSEASNDDSGDDQGSEAGSDGSDSSSGGHPGEAGPTDAGCTNGGSLCSCSGTSDCSTETPICAQAADVGADLGHAGFCTKPCCTSADCSAGAVCFASGQGGNYCVDPAWLGRSTPASSAIGGASCASGSECRSGLCASGTSGNVCADTCCSFAGSSAECASGSQCAFGFFQGSAGPDRHFAALCGPPGGAGTAGSPCSVSAECAGGFCYTGASSSFCVQPCAVPTECGSGYACQLDINGTDLYAACFQFAGGNAQGSQCDNFQNCLGGLCNGGLCSNPCFSDAVCTSGWRCKPEVDDSYPLGPQNQEYTVLACGP